MTQAQRAPSLVALWVCITALVADPVALHSAGAQPAIPPEVESAENATRYEVDLDAARRLWNGDPAVESVEDLLRVTLEIEGRKFVADTHLFGAPLRVIPYHNGDGVFDAAGEPVARGDAALAEWIRPGSIGFAVRHRRPSYREISLDRGLSEIKNELQLRDSHVEILVGVMRDGQPGVVTVNIPQAYEDGRFGGAAYPMIFLEPQLPDGLSSSLRRQFLDNQRTYLVGFDALAHFPLNYSGGDPLAARDRPAVELHAEKMVRAVAGDLDARRWFKERENLLYCSELAHLAASAGLLLPLNRRTFVPLVGGKVWRRFEKELEVHNRGEPSAFTTLNDNTWVGLIELAIAPEPLRPAPHYLPELASPGRELAFRPMTLVDLAEQFLRSYLPREQLGEEVAPYQAQLLAAAKPALFQVTDLDRLDPIDPRRIEAERVFEDMLAVVAKQYDDYTSFRIALGPLLAEGSRIAKAQQGEGGLFVPPSLLHLMAQDRWPSGMLGVRYLGHGFHYSLVRRER